VKSFQYWTSGFAFCACIGSGIASGQNVAKPYPAIFGGAAPSTPINGPVLDLSLQAYDAYDDNLHADIAGSPTAALTQASGYYTALEPTATLTARPGHTQIVATGSSSVRYYSDLHDVLATGQTAAIGIDSELNRQTNLFVNQAVTYAPAYLHGLFATTSAVAPGTPIAPGNDYIVDTERSIASATTARLTRVITPRLELSSDAGYRLTDFIGNAPGYFDLRSYYLGGTMRYSLNRNLKLRLGYTYRFTEYSPQYHPEENNIDIGFEYSRPLSSLRRTTFAFTLGPAIASGVTKEVNAPAYDRQYRLGADFLISHQFSRTWSLRGSAHRGLDYIENVPRPILTNAASSEVQGFLNRRTDVTVSAGYTTGELALNGTPPPFSTYTGLARLRFAFARRLAVFGEYFYYYYEFNQGFPLPPNMSSRLTRNGVRVGVTLWAPVGRK
jgi:hypothetical protein